MQRNGHLPPFAMHSGITFQTEASKLNSSASSVSLGEAFNIQTERTYQFDPNPSTVVAGVLQYVLLLAWRFKLLVLPVPVQANPPTRSHMSLPGPAMQGTQRGGQAGQVCVTSMHAQHGDKHSTLQHCVLAAGLRHAGTKERPERHSRLSGAHCTMRRRQAVWQRDCWDPRLPPFCALGPRSISLVVSLCTQAARPTWLRGQWRL